MGCPAAFYINILSLFTEIFWSPSNCSQSRVEMSETPATAKLVIIISAMTGEVPTKFDIKSKSINTKCMEIIIDFDNYLSPAGPSASSPLSRRSRPGKVLNKVFRMEKVWQQGRRKVFSGAGERERQSLLFCGPCSLSNMRSVVNIQDIWNFHVKWIAIRRLRI